MSSPALPRALGMRDLIGLNLVAIIGLRWLMTAARTGPASLLLWGAAFLFFFVPQGLAVVELSSRLPEEGGVYRWTKHAFGGFHGFICGWCYWSNNLIYYPSLLIYLGGVAAMTGGEQTAGWEENRWWVALFSLVALWVVILLNLVGLRSGRWVNNLGALATWIPITVLVAGAGFALWRWGSATPFARERFAEGFSFDCLPFWATMCFAFAGLELAPVMSGEVIDPRRNIPRAIIVSGILITFVYIAGTASILIILPAADVNIITGIVEALGQAGDKLGLSGAGRWAAALITLGGLGGAAAWLAGSARIPFVAGIDRFLPRSLGRVHPRWGTPHVALVWQGVAASIFVGMGLLGAGVEEAYLVLLDATILIYFVPYLYLFASLVYLRWREGAGEEGTVAVPGGRGGTAVVAALGLGATSLSMLLALFPGTEVADPRRFTIKVAVGGSLFLLAGILLYWRGRGRGAGRI